MQHTDKPRRGFIQGLMATAAGATLAAPALARPVAAAVPAVILDSAKWAPRNRELIAALIAKHGITSKTYNPKRKPYAVFD